jgi:hypothetical protein
MISLKHWCTLKSPSTLPGILQEKCSAKESKEPRVPDHDDIRATDALGRVYTIHPNNVECYFFRLLLHAVGGPISFESLKTVEGEMSNF